MLLKGKTVETLINSDDVSLMKVGLKDCASNVTISGDHVPVDKVIECLNSSSTDVSLGAIEALRNIHVPVETIKNWMDSGSQKLKLAAMKASYGRFDVPIELLEAGIRSTPIEISIEAQYACLGREIPAETIIKWAGSPSESFRDAALIAVVGKTVLESVKNSLVHNSNIRIREKAKKMYELGIFSCF